MLLYSLLSRMNALLKRGAGAFHRAGWFDAATLPVSVSEREGPFDLESYCYCKHLGDGGNISPAVNHCCYLDSVPGV